MVGEHMSGTSIDSRTSYIGGEIVWGARCHLPLLNCFGRKMKHCIEDHFWSRFINKAVTPCPETECYLCSFTQEDIDRYELVTSLSTTKIT